MEYNNNNNSNIIAAAQRFLIVADNLPGFMYVNNNYPLRKGNLVTSGICPFLVIETVVEEETQIKRVHMSQ